MDIEYTSLQNMAAQWNMSKRRIQVLCKEGRFPEAKMIGNMWVLPKETAKPMDARTKNPIAGNNEKHENIRTALKNLLKKMYCINNDCTNKKMQRDTVLGMLASALIANYISSNRNDIYKKISEELNLPSEIIPELWIEAKAFVNKYNDNNEIDNIVSWAYQYSNKILGFHDYTNTQFFTEQYMIQYLIKQMTGILTAEKIVDPCCGGGNFLLECMEIMCQRKDISKKEILCITKKLYGYDIDKTIAKIALINLKIKTIAILTKYNFRTDISVWDEIEVNIFISAKENIGGALDFSPNHKVINMHSRKIVTINYALGNADFVLTNPPFATIKGMDDTLKHFLKLNYTLSCCDTCVSFLSAISKMLSEHGICGIVTQNSWMYLNSFEGFRAKFLESYAINYILNLGAGAFIDLSGEKTNVSLLIAEKSQSNDSLLFYQDLSKDSYDEKNEKVLNDSIEYQVYSQKTLNSPFYGFDFSTNTRLKEILASNTPYAKIATPMQGTSTGNAKMLVGYFWEHFGDSDWRLVSKGGGYCRWQGLNSSVVKWGENGEFIRNEKGSALRNTKYFNDTFMVFSDTGTSGLNVRKTLPSQIFIASGPGIRINSGNAYAQIAYLNSRIASYYIKKMSPKFTIAAGYIGKLPICETIYNSSLLERNAKLCINLKEKFLSTRPTNYEYDSSYLCGFSGSLDECASKWFINDLNDELLKLEIENQIDAYILEQFHLKDTETAVLNNSIGVPSAFIKKEKPINIKNMDKYIAHIMNEMCTLKKICPKKNEMGCDGILEYTTRNLDINPVFLFHEIEKNLNEFEQVMKIYKNLILHNEVLELMGYHTKNGIGNASISFAQASDFFHSKYEIDTSAWIRNDFFPLHTKIFKNKPLFICHHQHIMRRDIS